ncbi:uncharacterized protein, partial [Choristoneura fumiferana]|uniref:uncharacterized protein n=1 Tax=Choristoneura fumiferana TaxID=7141 RepID=UPI003D159168
MENCLSLWRCFTLVALCGGNELTPVKVLYSKPYTMTVVLELMNVPIEVTGYVINEKKRNKSYNEVKSGDNLPAEYYKAGEKRELILPFKVILEKSNSHTIYEVFLKANGVYCNRALNREFLQIVYTEKEQSVDILSKITLDWKNECLNTAPKETDKRDSGTLTDKVREDQREPEQPAENNKR